MVIKCTSLNFIIKMTKERTSTTLNKSTLTKLNKIKYKFGCKSIDETISRLINILTKFKMHEEFKELK